jgi:TPR repeat protein
MTMTTPVRLLATLAAAFLWSAVAHADLDHIKRSAEAGDAEAQLELGILFQYGFRLKDNEIPALTWYSISANQGNAKAAKLRDALMSKMNPKEVEEAMEQVKSFKAKPLPAGTAPFPAAPTPETRPESAAAPTPATAPEPAAPAPAAAPAEPAPPAPAPAPTEAAPPPASPPPTGQ